MKKLSDVVPKAAIHQPRANPISMRTAASPKTQTVSRIAAGNQSTRRTARYAAQGREEAADLDIHLRFVGHGLGDFFAEQLAIPLAHSIRRLLGCRRGDPQGFRRPLVVVGGCLARQGSFELLEVFGAVCRGQFQSQTFQRVIQQRQHPTPLVQFLRRQLVERLDLVARFPRFKIQRQRPLPPAPLFRARFVCFIAEEVFERRKEEIAKTTSLGIGSNDRVSFEQMTEKSLSQVSRLVHLANTTTNVGVQGIPVCLAELRECDFGFVPVDFRGGQYDAPSGRGEVPLSAIGQHTGLTFGHGVIVPHVAAGRLASDSGRRGFLQP